VAKFVGTTNIFGGKLINLDGDPEIEIPDLGVFKLPPLSEKWMREGCEILLSLRPRRSLSPKRGEKLL
jgi:hypothetical protein